MNDNFQVKFLGHETTANDAKFYKFAFVCYINKPFNKTCLPNRYNDFHK